MTQEEYSLIEELKLPLGFIDLTEDGWIVLETYRQYGNLSTVQRKIVLVNHKLKLEVQIKKYE